MNKPTTLIIAVAAIAAVLLLSGCTSKEAADNKNVTAVPTENVKETVTAPEETETETVTEPVITAAVNASAGGENTSALETPSGWCVPGSKIDVDTSGGRKAFTVDGRTTYKGMDVCQASLVTANGKTTYYFTENRLFEEMNSTASGKNVSASANTSVTSTGNSTGNSTGANSTR